MKIASLDFIQRHVESPLRFTPREHAQIAARVFVQIGRDNVPVVAAGVAFFTLLSIFPLISASLSIYGFFADLSDVQGMIGFLRPLLPEEAWTLISDQIAAVIDAPDDELSLRIFVSLLFAFYTAGAGIRAVLRAMNVAYDEDEKRSLLAFYAVAFVMTIGMFVLVYAALFIVVALPAILHFMRLDQTANLLSGYLPWVLLIVLFMLGAFVVYRFGPSRRPARKRWVTPGVIFTTVTWLALSYGFSFFVRNFGRYDATYGSLSAVIILLLWFWLTSMTVIVGAELNAEMERQTLADTTRGDPRPVGLREARMADFLTAAMRRLFPDRFPHAPGLAEQLIPADTTPPDVPQIDPLTQDQADDEADAEAEDSEDTRV
ncbi:MAG: YihY/virulence factor BrkB family protein [Litorimonas sp.]